jgi:hypothetical protein
MEVRERNLGFAATAATGWLLWKSRWGTPKRTAEFTQMAVVWEG